MADDRTARRRLLAYASGLALSAMVAAPAMAQTTDGAAPGPSPLEARINEQDRQLAQQAAQLRLQEQELQEQRKRLDLQSQMMERLLAPNSLQDLRGTGDGPAQPATAPPTTVAQSSPAEIPPSSATPSGPVGEAPPAQAVKVEAAAVPQEASVLTRVHHLVVEPDLEYTQTTANRLVFQGVELVPGINLGVIEASATLRSISVATLDARYGLTPRIELEARVPYLWRADRIDQVQQNDQTVTVETNMHTHGLGDAEFAARYEINPPKGSNPVFIVGLRVKSDSGSNPYTVQRNSFGTALQLATGSGFWGVEPSVSFLLPSDPAVIYGSLSYFGQFSKQMDADVGNGVHIGRVYPGGSIGLGGGFGAALNDHFSFSLGYRHNYFFPTVTTIGSITGNTFTTSKQRSTSIQVGVLQFGASYVVSHRTVFTSSFEFGVTSDAPNVHITLRAPTSF